MNIFQVEEQARKKVNWFPTSFNNLLSMNFGQLVPIMVRETIPGTMQEFNVQSMCRMAELIGPAYIEADVRVNFFGVPKRVLFPMEQFEDWIQEKEDILPPMLTLDGVNLEHGSLGDYLGYPTEGVAPVVQELTAWRLLAYYKIYDDYYRYQKIQDPYDLHKTVTPGVNISYGPIFLATPPRTAGRKPDYFTSCLPSPQEGPEVILPLGTFDDVPVDLNIVTNDPPLVQGMRLRRENGTYWGGTPNLRVESPNSELFADPGNERTYLDPNNHLVALTSQLEAQAAGITAVRLAFQMQAYYEAYNRIGDHYNEWALAMYGVYTSDRRLQNAEYYGGFSYPLSVSETMVTATTVDSNDNIVGLPGQYAGHGIGVGASDTIRIYSEEHMVIMAIAHVVPKTSYWKGIHRDLTRVDPLDHALPHFALIGDQPVFNYEINSLHDDPLGVFGYQIKDADYKSAYDEIHGEFRGSLAYWHLAHDVPTNVALNLDFLDYQNTNSNKRIFAVDDPNTDSLYFKFTINCNTRLPLPKYEVPSIQGM